METKIRKRRLTVYLDPDLYVRLRVEAITTSSPVSSVVESRLRHSELAEKERLETRKASRR